MVGTKQRLSNSLLTSTACLTAVGLVLAMAATAQARVTRIAVEKKVSPAFDGASFGSAGQYETLAGKAFGELDPNEPRNAVIQDIKLAPRNGRGGSEAQRVTTPSWIITFSRFPTPQCSAILPFTTRITSTVSNSTSRPVGATPRKVPACVPR